MKFDVGDILVAKKNNTLEYFCQITNISKKRKTYTTRALNENQMYKCEIYTNVIDKYYEKIDNPETFKLLYC